MIQFKVSAPGKVILFGEHAVVYGKTAVAASLGLRTNLEFQELSDAEPIIKLIFPKVNLVKAVPVQQIRDFIFSNSVLSTEENYDIFYNKIQQFVQTIGYTNLKQKLCLEAFFYLLVYVSHKQDMNITPCQIHLTSELSISSGLGSSASFSVCLAACFLHLSRLQKNIKMPLNIKDLETVSQYAFKCEKIMHGTPSGIDNCVCTYGSVIEYKKDQHVKPIFGVKSMKILLVDTRVQRSTKVLVETMVELRRRYTSIIDPIFESIDNISQEALHVIRKIRDFSTTNTEDHSNEYTQLMTLIRMNQGLLATCQISHPSLDRICAEAHNYALAGKLTGAGGGGYAYILLFPHTEPETISSITRKLMADGYTVTLTNLGCAGVEIHE